MQTSREPTANERLNYAIWRCLDDIQESLQGEETRQIDYSVDLNITMPGYGNVVKQNMILRILKKEGVIEEVGEPDILEIGKHDQNYKVFEEHHLIITNKFEDFYQKYFNLVFKPSAVSEKQAQEPIPVTIVGEIGIKGFEEKVILQKPKNKKIQLRKFPTDLKWEEITIRFLNEHEVIATARNDTFQTNYELLGFRNEKTKLPNKQWQFLKGLSETGGEISWTSPRATAKGKKQKQILAETLRACFQIEGDPFHPYRKEKSYKIRINLVPESSSTANSKEQEIYGKDRDDLGIEEYRKEQSPEIYEK